jgi:alanyl-tRNA synthetase
MSNYENFDEQKKFACRVVADHARSTAFAIADGILPGNEGRNYVLRKIMRRAIYHGREHLGFEGLFFHKVCGFVVEQMKSAYPELEQQKDFIDKMVQLEEHRFGNTLRIAIQKLTELTEEYGGINYPLEELAKLKDTFGTPTDLIYVFLNENDKRTFSYEEILEDDDSEIEPETKIISIKDLSGETFNDYIEMMIARLQTSNNIGKTQQAEKINPIYAALQRTSVKSTFIGYDTNSVEDAKVIALVKDNEQVNELQTGDEGLIILDETPFYAESGGQVGDSGTIKSVASALADASSNQQNAFAHANATDKSANIRVFDTFAPIAGIVLHKSKIESGTIKVGDSITATIDVEKRDATRRNHTATHLVHSALREVLGTHVKQAGSVVAPNYLRFDFTHYQPLSPSEIKEIEDLVNYQILQNSKVHTDLMSIEDAMRTGAMALFGEKYGEKVRVLSVGNGEFSRELCGGTHVHATGDIGSFKITADEAIASGVRRIRAITGFDSFNRFRDAEELIANSLNVLKTQRDNLPNAIEKLQEELKKTRKEVDDLKMKIATGAISGDSGQGEAKDIAGIKVIAKTVEGLDKGGMRHLSDSLMAKIKSGVVIIAKTEDEKVSFIIRVSDDLTKQVSAGNIVREIAPIVGGRGGGKPDMAEGGGTDAGKLNDAIEASYGVIEKMLV